jgi:hypothetical protein
MVGYGVNVLADPNDFGGNGVNGMITLDFVLDQPITMVDDVSAEQMMSLFRVTLFLGHQKLVTNDIDFTRTVPVMWAAREMCLLMKQLRTGSRETFVFKPMIASHPIMFVPTENEVGIEGLGKISDEEPGLISTSVPSLELCDAIKRSSRATYKKLSKLWPPLNEKEWHDWYFGKQF